MRMSLSKRILRFLFLILSLYCGIGFIIKFSNGEFYQQQCSLREICNQYCQTTQYANKSCEIISNTSYQFKGALYQEFYVFPYSTLPEYKICYQAYSDKSRTTLPSFMDSSKIAQVAVCIRNCHPSNATKEAGYEIDNRKDCENPIPTKFSLYCITPTSPCENLGGLLKKAFFQANSTDITSYIIILAIIIGDFIQFAFEFSLYYYFEILAYNEGEISAMQISNSEEEEATFLSSNETSCWESLTLCVALLISIGIVIIVLILAISWTMLFRKLGILIVCIELTFICFAFDQFKAIFVQVILYISIVRRFFYLLPNFQGGWSEELSLAKEEDSLYDTMKKKINEFILTNYVITFNLITIILNTIIILFENAASNLIKDSEALRNITSIIDKILAVIFILETSTRIFVYGFSFFENFLTFLDSLVVYSTGISILVGMNNVNITNLRILRVFRLVLGLKEVHDQKLKIKSLIEQQKKQGITLVTPNIEFIRTFLQEFTTNPDVSYILKMDIENILDHISKGNFSNKIYKEESKNVTLENKLWNAIIANNINEMPEPSESIKKPILSLNEVKYLSSNSDIIISKASLIKDLELNPNEVLHLDKAFEKKDSISFDAFSIFNSLGVRGFQYFSALIISDHVDITKLCIKRDTFLNFLKDLYESYLPIPYHNISSIMDSIQFIHLFLILGDMKSFLNLTDTFALFLVALGQYIGHPGYTNKFLMRSRHPLSQRYNDKGILENYHSSNLISLIYSNDRVNIFKELREEDKRRISVIIREVLCECSMQKHYILFDKLKNAIEFKINPTSSEDRLLFCSLCLKAAEYSKMARAENLSSKWRGFLIEEFLKQGDDEEELHFTVSILMNRHEINPEKMILAYIDVICFPFLSMFVLLASGNSLKQILIKDGIEKNRKSIENRIDTLK